VLVWAGSSEALDQWLPVASSILDSLRFERST